MSFNSDRNMRMGLNDFSANDVINKLNTIELEKSLDFLVKKEAKKIANQIVYQKRIKFGHQRIG